MVGEQGGMEQALGGMVEVILGSEEEKCTLQVMVGGDRISKEMNKSIPVVMGNDRTLKIIHIIQYISNPTNSCSNLITEPYMRQ